MSIQVPVDLLDGLFPVYISGPMTGLPEFNYPAFHLAERRLASAGIKALNPARHGIIEGADWAAYMRLAIRDVSYARGVALLPGWWDSRGASLEVTIATNLRIPVQPLEEWLP